MEAAKDRTRKSEKQSVSTCLSNTCQLSPCASSEVSHLALAGGTMALSTTMARWVSTASLHVKLICTGHAAPWNRLMSADSSHKCLYDVQLCCMHQSRHCHTQPDTFVLIVCLCCCSGRGRQLLRGERMSSKLPVDATCRRGGVALAVCCMLEGSRHILTLCACCQPLYLGWGRWRPRLRVPCCELITWRKRPLDGLPKQVNCCGQ
jgi:hypothetical protein